MRFVVRGRRCPPLKQKGEAIIPKRIHTHAVTVNTVDSSRRRCESDQVAQFDHCPPIQFGRLSNSGLSGVLQCVIPRYSPSEVENGKKGKYDKVTCFFAGGDAEKKPSGRTTESETFPARFRQGQRSSGSLSRSSQKGRNLSELISFYTTGRRCG